MRYLMPYQENLMKQESNDDAHFNEGIRYDILYNEFLNEGLSPKAVSEKATNIVSMEEALNDVHVQYHKESAQGSGAANSEYEENNKHKKERSGGFEDKDRWNKSSTNLLTIGQWASI